jgi:hypothetical protein
VRGKLRDKRSIAKRDYFKRDGAERRRPVKRDKRANWQQFQADDDGDDIVSDEEEEEWKDEAGIPAPKK